MKTSQKAECLQFFNIQKIVPLKIRKSAEIPQSDCLIKKNKIQQQKQSKQTTTKHPTSNHTNRNIYLQAFGYGRENHKSFTLLCVKTYWNFVAYQLLFLLLLLFKYLCNFIGLSISIRN